MNIKKNVLLEILKRAYIITERAIFWLKRWPYMNRVYDTLVRTSNLTTNTKVCIGNNLLNVKDISVISSNCFAGRIMQDIKMEYNTPTLGLYFMYPDYIEFLKNLEFYLKEAKLQFVDSSKYELGNTRRARWSHRYPIGLLDGKIEIHFLHYHSEEEASEKWYRRARRVNFNNLFIMGMDQNLCTEDDIKEFDNLPYKNKIMFSTHNIPLESNEFMPEFEGKESVGDPYSKGHIFYRHLIAHFNKTLINRK